MDRWGSATTLALKSRCLGACQFNDDSRFQRSQRFFGINPGRCRGRCRWAGMSDAFGVKRDDRRSTLGCGLRLPSATPLGPLWGGGHLAYRPSHPLLITPGNGYVLEMALQMYYILVYDRNPDSSGAGTVGPPVEGQGPLCQNQPQRSATPFGGRVCARREATGAQCRSGAYRSLCRDLGWALFR